MGKGVAQLSGCGRKEREGILARGMIIIFIDHTYFFPLGY